MRIVGILIIVTLIFILMPYMFKKYYSLTNDFYEKCTPNKANILAFAIAAGFAIGMVLVIILSMYLINFAY